MPIPPFPSQPKSPLSPPSEDFLKTSPNNLPTRPNIPKTQSFTQSKPKLAPAREDSQNSPYQAISNQNEQSISSGFKTLGKSSLNNFSQEYVVPRDLQFINDKPFLKLSRREINLNELFLRLGTQKNSFLKLSSDLVYQYHKYSVSNFSE